jgi:RNA polymerase sigma-70 factor, ECF subfamily
MATDPELARLADEDLLALVERGDADAFEAIYDRHSRVAYSLAFRLLGDRQAAEDLVQDAMLAVWRGAAGYRPAKGSVRNPRRDVAPP